MKRKTNHALASLTVMTAALPLVCSAVMAQSTVRAPVHLEEASFPKLYNTLERTAAQFSFPVAVLDINGDEMMDVFIGQGQGRNDLIAIQHPGQPWSVHSLDDDTGATYGAQVSDLNHDFIDDLIVTRDAGVFVYAGLERGGFATPVLLPDSEHGPSEMTRAVLVGDINNDGWTDVYAVRGSSAQGGAENRLWINLGVTPQAKFREAASGAGVSASGDNVAGVIADLDDDGFADLVVAPKHGKPLVFQNKGDGNFQSADIKLPSLNDVAGISATDVDHDGDVDLLMTVKSPSADRGMHFFRNEGDLVLSDHTRHVGLALKHGVDDAVWVDLNNDGYRDLLVSGRSTREQQQSFAMVQQHGGEFQRVGLDDFFSHVPAYWAVSDFNRDGVMDMLGVPDKGEITLRHGALYRNNWLGIKLRGRGNRSVHGADVTLRMADGTHYHHRFGIKRSTSGDIDSQLMFGLGRRSEISILEIKWPSGKYTRVDDPELNRHIGFIEPKGGAGSADLSIRHTIVGYVDASRQARRDNPGLNFLKPEESYVCR